MSFMQHLGKILLAMFVVTPLWALAYPKASGEDMTFLIVMTGFAAMCAFMPTKEPRK